MSPSAAGLAVLLHAAVALAFWENAPLRPHDLADEAIEVTIEQPKLEEPKPEPPKPEPPKTEQAKPTPPPKPDPPPPPVQQAMPPPPPPAASSPSTAGPRVNAPRPVFGMAAPPPELREAPKPAEQQQAMAPPTAATLPPPALDRLLPPLEMPSAPATSSEAPKPAAPPAPTPAPAAPPPPAPAPPQPRPAPTAPQQVRPSPLHETHPPSAGPQASAAPPPSGLQNPADNYRKLRAQEEYLWRISARISQYRYYSRDSSEHGTVVIRVVIARDGRLIEANVARSSGFVNLDKGVLEAARSAAPYFPLPPEIPGDAAAFTVPLTYAFRR